MGWVAPRARAGWIVVGVPVGCGPVPTYQKQEVTCLELFLEHPLP